SSKHVEKENQLSDEKPGCSGIKKSRSKAHPLPSYPEDSVTLSEDDKKELASLLLLTDLAILH
ncbi:hypothetical protein JRQ81_019604, partial [Phrynocephalus forsythii]